MKYIVALSIAITSCKNNAMHPMVAIPVNVADTILMDNNDTIYQIKKSPNGGLEFGINTNYGEDTVVIKNNSK